MSSQDTVIIADLPQRGTMFSLESVTGKLLEMAHKVRE
jgi:hypothetical protein